VGQGVRVERLLYHYRINSNSLVTWSLDPAEYVSPDASRVDASGAGAEAELAAWREILDGAKGRRR
jgi:hypothetical protein